jgi:DNA-binding transcriptional regulator LsrR (DeoR family)
MNWKNYVEATQSKTYVLPEGWDTRDTIADQLGCSADNVRKLLAPAIKTGAVEFKQLPLWDKVLKKVRSVACYRRTGK